MKKFVQSTIFLVIISSFTIMAQSSGFKVLLEEDMTYVVDMINTSSGNLIIAGFNSVRDPVYILEISTEGNILWSKHFSAQMLWYANVLQTSDDHILVPLSRHGEAYILELNQSGDSIGCISLLEYRASYFESVIEMPDGTLFASEIFYDDNPIYHIPDSSIIVKLNADLTLAEKYATQLFNICDLKVCSATKFYALGAEPNFNNFLNVVNLDGQVVSNAASPDLDPELHFTCLRNDNSLLAAGSCDDNGSMSAALANFDNNSQTVFCHTYPGDYFNSVTIDESDTKIFTLGNSGDSCFIYTIDDAGNLINRFFVDDSLSGNNILLLDDYFYITGVYYYLGRDQYDGAYLIKIPRNSILSLTEKKGNSLVKTYPNPASDYVIFEYQPDDGKSILADNKAFVNVRDINGKLIDQFQFNSGKFIWDTGQTSPGMYFYTIQTASLNIAGKLIIVK